MLTNTESAVFPIRRGTKQGDPVSSLLFNTVLQFDLENDLKNWKEKNQGILLSDRKEGCLTNLRFAEDVLLFSTSLNKLKDMLCDFKKSTEKVGLEILPNKTKILSKQNSRRQREVMIDNIKIEVMHKSESAKNLGQKITFEEQEMAEIKNRLKSAWAAFCNYREELTSRSYRLCRRLRLFNILITPTLTYASGTWTSSRMIITAQRKMNRFIVQTKRKYNK